MAACHGRWLSPEELARNRVGLAHPGSRLYAVFQAGPPWERFSLVPSDHGIMFAAPGRSALTVSATSIWVREAGIVEISYGCGDTPEARLPAMGSVGPLEFVLPPPERRHE